MQSTLLIFHLFLNLTHQSTYDYLVGNKKKRELKSQLSKDVEEGVSKKSDSDFAGRSSSRKSEDLSQESHRERDENNSAKKSAHE